MTARRQWTVVGVVIAVLGIALAIGSHYMKDDLFPVEPGSRAPDFRAKVLGSNQYRTLADYKRDVYPDVNETFPRRTTIPAATAGSLHDLEGLQRFP